MKKKLLLFFLAGSFNLNAQNVIFTSFHDKDGATVKNIEAAEYVRTITTGEIYNQHNYIENWTDGTKKREGYITSKFELIGKETCYHKNGKVSHIQFIDITKDKKGRATCTGKIEQFYENGKLKESGEFTNPTPIMLISRFDYPNYITYQIADSLGNTYLDSLGNGKINITYSNGNTIEGEYIKGLKHGEWKEFFAKDNDLHLEKYKNGVFINGLHIDKNGKKASYKEKEIEAGFEGGTEAFFKFLAKTLRYPTNMRESGIEGRVHISFTIEKNGQLSNLKIVNGVENGKELDEEALRVLSVSPPWQPAIQKGKTMAVTYSVPITFRLGY